MGVFPVSLGEIDRDLFLGEVGIGGRFTVGVGVD